MNVRVQCYANSRVIVHSSFIALHSAFFIPRASFFIRHSSFSFFIFHS